VDQKHISLLNVEHDLSKLCLGYLTFPHLDESQLDTEIKALALKGAYSFLDYAGIYWMCHLEEWARNTDIADPSIIDLLRRFLQEYWAVSMSKSTASSVRTTFALFAKLDIFVPLLSAVSTWKEQCDTYGTNVLSSDTLKLVDRISRVRAIIEKILIESAGNNGLEQTLYAFYGANLYKCSRLSCRFFEDGFPTAAQRDNHLKKHLRAFTCTQSSCPYAIVGFKTRKELERHASASHSEFNGVSTYPVTRDPKSINVKQAIRQGCDIEEVEKWLEQFPSSDGFSSQIQGAAICAIKNGNQSYVEVLLKGRFLNVANYLNLISIALKAKQDDIAIHIQGLSATSLCVRRTSGPNSDTPIFIAFQEGRVSFIRHVVQIPNVITDLIRHTPEGFAIFQYAIEKNCLSVIRLLIKFWPTEFWLSKNQNGELPAHVAIKASNAATLRILLESNKCDINPPRDSGETSLHLAAIQGNAAFVQMLLSAGCVLENSQEETISDPARCGYEEVVNILGTYWPSSHEKWLGVAQLHNAAMEGDVEVVQRLLARTDVRIPVDLSHPISGKTPLIAAVDRGHTSVVAQLIARQDVNVNEKAFDEAWHPRLCTPLVVAVIKGYDWIVELLLTRSDIKLHIPYTWQAEGVNSNLNVLEIAHILENEKITKLLLERLEADAPEAEPDEAEPLAAANLSLEERIEIPSNNGSNFNADIFPWTNDNPENILTETAIRQGYYDKMVLQKNETDTARLRLWPRLKDKSGQQELFGLFAAALEMRQRNSRAPSHDAAPSLSEESPKGADLQFELSTAQAAEQLAHSSPQSLLDRLMEQDARESSR
jgi:ankyrin repeat protein